MTSDALQIIQLVFTTIWKLFTGWHIPGTNVSPAGWFLFLISAGIGLKIIVRILSHAANSSSGSSSTGRPGKDD